MANNDETVAASSSKRPAKTILIDEKNMEQTVASEKPTKVVQRTVVASNATVKTPSTGRRSSATPTKGRIGNYIKEKKLAQGGMGAVYIAKHPDLDTRVIIKKLLLKDNAAAEERFKREANILRELQCPYIVNTFEYFRMGKSSYLVEELVDGCSLDKLIEKYKNFRNAELKDNPDSTLANTGPLGMEIALLIFLDACYGLRFAHKRKIVHRDIKPGNLLISKHAEVKLTDFGIAADDKVENSDDDDDEEEDIVAESDGLTIAGSMLGTPSYMSPEQIEDSSSVDSRADIYSMGVMLYEMLTGEKPFGCPINFKTFKADEEVMKTIKKGKYKDPRKLNPSVPLIISLMIRKMLKYDRNKRFATMDPVIRILKKQISKYNAHDLRVELARIICNIDSKNIHRIQRFTRKKPIIHIVLASMLGGILLTSGANWLWKSGKIHQTILSPWYSPVNLTMQIPDRGIDNGYSSNLPMVAYVFEEDGNQDLVAGSYREFKLVEETVDASAQKKAAAKIFAAKPIYLTKGTYRVKVVLGSYVIWKSLKVEKGAVNVLFDDLLKEKREISVITSAFDLKTKKKLNAKFTVMNSKGNYVLFKDITQKERTAMKVWKVRASCEGYSTREFSMVVDWYQDTIIVNVGLE